MEEPRREGACLARQPPSTNEKDGKRSGKRVLVATFCRQCSNQVTDLCHMTKYLIVFADHYPFFLWTGAGLRD